MKALSTKKQALVLAIVTLMSAGAFAAGAGETKDVPCQPVATKDGAKAQKASSVQSDDAAKKPADSKKAD